MATGDHRSNDTGYLQPDVNDVNPGVEEKVMKAIDRLGEYFHNNLCAVMIGMRDNEMLSELGIKHANIMENLLYSEIPPEDKERVRAHSRVLLLEVMKDMCD